MKNLFLLGCLSILQIVTVHGMDQASLAVVTIKEVSALARCEATRLHLQCAGFRMTTKNEKLTDDQTNPRQFSLDDVVKNQVVPLILQKRMARANAQGIAVQEDSLKEMITENVLTVWNARKK